MRHTLLSLSIVCISLAAASPFAAARERHSTVTGPQGQSVQRDTQRAQGDVSTTTSGPQGRQWQRSVDRSAEGTAASVSGPNGRSVSRSTSRSAASATQ